VVSVSQAEQQTAVQSAGAQPDLNPVVQDASDSALNGDMSPVRSWVFKPNCSLTPRQLAGFYLSIVLVTLGIAAGFCLFGLWIVLPFAGIELLAVGIALLVYARHAGDYERIELRGRELTVIVVRGSREYSVSFNPGWTKVSLPKPGELLRLESGSTWVAVGRYVTAPVRERLAYELRRAFAAAAA